MGLKVEENDCPKIKEIYRIAKASAASGKPVLINALIGLDQYLFRVGFVVVLFVFILSLKFLRVINL